MEANLNIYVFTTRFVLKELSPIVYVMHESDGDWQFLGKEDGLKEEDAMIISLAEMLKHDPTLITILDLPKGKEATRHDLGKEWIIKTIK